MRGSSKTNPVPEQQAVAALDQAAPVQNTWYTVLDTTKNARIITFGVEVADTGESLEGRMTVDGVTLTLVGFVAVADTPYWALMSADPGVGTLGPYFSGTNPTVRSFLIEGRSVKLEVRKTTATGVGNLKGVAWYQTF